MINHSPLAQQNPASPPPALDPDEEETFWGTGGVQPAPILDDEVLADSQQAGSQVGVQPPLGPPLPSFKQATELYIPTHKYPPKSVRPEFTRCLADIWQKIADAPGDEHGWLLSYIFPRVILPAGQGPAREATSRVQVIRERLRRWRQGEHSSLWQEATKIAQSRPKKRRRRRGAPAEQEKSQHDKNVERASRLAEEGNLTKA